MKWQLAAMSADERAAFMELFRQISLDPTIGVPVDFDDLPEDIQRSIERERGREHGDQG